MVEDNEIKIVIALERIADTIQAHGEYGAELQGLISEVTRVADAMESLLASFNGLIDVDGCLDVRTWD